MLSKYRELLLIPLFFLLFRDEVTRQWGVYAFLAAMAITLLLSYVLAFTGWDVGKGTADNPFIFKNHITQGLLMSLAAYFVAVFWLEETVTWRRWLYTLILLLAIANVVFMTQGRTGYLVLASLILLFLYQAYQWRGIIVGIIGLTLLGTAAYWASHVVQNRVNKVAENVESYKHGQSKTSIGLRFEFYRNSLSLVKQKPVFGAGTGSFANEYAKLAQQRNLTATTNPHNEYLMIAVQWGLLGLGLFLYLFYRLWQLSQDLLPAYDWLAQGLILTMVTGCLVNSLLLDFTEGHVFAYLVGALFAGYEPKSLVDVTIPEND